MRRILLSLIFAFITIAGVAQNQNETYIFLTPDGLTTKTGEDYIVVPVEGKTASEMYRTMEDYVVSTFRNPDAVMSKIDNSMINIHGVYADEIQYTQYVLTRQYIYATLDINLIVRFKDGKMRINIPSINEMYYLDQGRHDVYYSSIYNRRGEIKNRIFYNSLNIFLNDLINEIINVVKTPDEENDNNNW